MKRLSLLKILNLTLTLLVQSAFAGDKFEYEARVNHKGVQEIWLYKKTDNEYQKLGEVEIIKKGTDLFHWANATPEQARWWHEAGKISPKLLAKLKNTLGAAGGGFYVSTSPVDSARYGNTLVVVTLPKDMRILRTSATKNANWISHNSELEKMGVSAVTVPHRRTWMNILDAKMLTKEFVADENYFIDKKLQKLPGLKLLKNLFERFPNLQSDPYYQDMLKEAKQLAKAVKSTKHEIADAAVLRVLNQGESDYILDVISEMRPSYVTSEIVGKFSTLLQYEDYTYQVITGGIYTVAKRNPALRSQIYSVLLKLPTMHLFVLEGLDKIDTVTASNLLNEAALYHGKNIPEEIQEKIDKMKINKTWNPILTCDKIFAS